MSDLPKAPKAYQIFVDEYPLLADAWERIGDAGAEGPLDEKTQRLIKLAVAVGAMREGAVHSSVRKAVAMGVEPDALKQVVALAAGTLGLPGAVAIHRWIADVLDGE
ncbi:MAG: carboxymuconolactone decarboxylase family protein [Gemmatimonadales bacterium]